MTPLDLGNQKDYSTIKAKPPNEIGYNLSIDQRGTYTKNKIILNTLSMMNAY